MQMTDSQGVSAPLKQGWSRTNSCCVDGSVHPF